MPTRTYVTPFNTRWSHVDNTVLLSGALKLNFACFSAGVC